MRYFSDFERLAKEARLQAIIILALLVVVLVEGVMLYRASTHKLVVVMPPKVDKEFWVAGDKLSYAYIEQTAIYLADSLLSVSPATVDTSLSRVLPFLTTNPEQVKAIRDSFLLYAKSIKENDIYQAFYPMKVLVDERNQKIAVEGMLRKLTGSVFMGEERKIVEFNFKVENGRLIITGVKL